MINSVSLIPIKTEDGSLTFYHPTINEHYHSTHGALQESSHVYIRKGLSYFQSLHEAPTIKILEVGFGTGLNFLLSADFATTNHFALDYVGIESFPLSNEQINSMGYGKYLDNEELYLQFNEKYLSSFEQANYLSSKINLRLWKEELRVVTIENQFDILYYDAFAYAKQPEMWTEESISYACQFLKDKGIFVTYSVTGNLKRTLRKLGFEIERLAGALGKREMMRATIHR